jgi:large subunit ribosomal protein L21
MFAVIKTGGKQYQVKEGDSIKVEKLAVEKDETFDFNEVLMVSDEKGDDLKLGTPIIEGAKVTAKVLAQGRAKKIDVIKYKRKVRYRRKLGHRQPYTEVKIEKITA